MNALLRIEVPENHLTMLLITTRVHCHGGDAILVVAFSTIFGSSERLLANYATELGFKLVTIWMLNTIFIFLMMLLIAYVNLHQSVGVRFVFVWGQSNCKCCVQHWTSCACRKGDSQHTGWTRSDTCTKAGQTRPAQTMVIGWGIIDDWFHIVGHLPEEVNSSYYRSELRFYSKLTQLKTSGHTYLHV
jgi:hypothetical protein